MNAPTVKVYNMKTGNIEMVATNVYNMFRETTYVLYLL